MGGDQEPPQHYLSVGSSQENVTRRRRSQSVATAQPSVETVVVKAKRAASTLWTLLHAQNCALAESCPHPGCREAKLLNLHLKVCPAGENFPCPTGHRGCDQARKLMGHYRRCRKSRARQAGQHPSRRDPNQNTCLVCSLVARQARSLIETKPASSSLNYSPKSATSSQTPSSSSSLHASHVTKKTAQPLRKASVSPTPVKKASGRRIVASFMLDGDNVVMPPPSPSTRTDSETKMPPPPSRGTPGGAATAPLPAATCVQVETNGMAPPLPVMPPTSKRSPDHPLTGAEQNNLEGFYRHGAAVARFRPRSASVGDSSLLFKATGPSPLMGCEPICEEEPVAITNNNGRMESSSSLTFDGLRYNDNSF